MRSKKSHIRFLTVSACGAALLSLSAWLVIPTPIPFTMQSLVLFFLLSLFGRAGFVSVLLYLFLGFLGLPVFAGFSGGISILLSPTGGYLIGFLPAALLFLLFRKGAFLWEALGGIAAIFVIYITGSLFYAFVYGAGGIYGFVPLIAVTVLPYLLPDGVKLFFALLLAKRLKPLLKPLL